MVRFSCFSSNIYSQRQKKTVQSSVEEMQKSLQDFSEIQAVKDMPNSKTAKSILSGAQQDTQSNDDAKRVASSSSIESCCKLGEMKGISNLESEVGVHKLGNLKKSQSLGSQLCWEGRYAAETDVEEETDQGFSSDSHDQHGEAGQSGSNDPAVSPPSEYQNVPHSESVQVSSNHVNNECIFSIGEPQNSEKEGHGNSDAMMFGLGDCAVNDLDYMPCTSPLILKSHSLPNINAARCPSEECYTNRVVPHCRSLDDFKVLGMRQKCNTINRLVPHSRSSDDIKVLGMRLKNISVYGVDTGAVQEQETDDGVCKTVKNKYGTQVDDCSDSCNYSALAKDWLIPDDVNSVKNLRGESSAQHLYQLPNKDFKIKRIEEWVNDLQHCSPLEATNEISPSDDQLKRDADVLHGLTASKANGKVSAGMEAAKRYISSLSAAATTAQLLNHGLAVIPFLSAFVSLKDLNLSGNAIVRITAGALPRGLHMLNLSKNNISTIEGLRELTRLRVLNLSYNRIFRIGHGLASCSSLKELYLAGNKISEVEGLHRLLKLTLLDLRFNKISTAKCLGQLAANYNSLQAISLEGNPAQKNVGDEQLKKYLQGLLPHLVYFNRQPMKTSTLKDPSDRSVRLGISAHQFDRGLRSDNKATLRSDNKAKRKSSHGVGSHSNKSSSSTHGHRSQTMVSPPKRSRGRHMRLPPSGAKAATNNWHNYLDIGSKLLNLRSEFSMRRSRSEGTLGAS